jgi:hypothetical protein
MAEVADTIPQYEFPEETAAFYVDWWFAMRLLRLMWRKFMSVPSYSFRKVDPQYLKRRSQSYF